MISFRLEKPQYPAFSNKSQTTFALRKKGEFMKGFGEHLAEGIGR